jgi:hypothetical protein
MPLDIPFHESVIPYCQKLTHDVPSDQNVSDSLPMRPWDFLGPLRHCSFVRRVEPRFFLSELSILIFL